MNKFQDVFNIHGDHEENIERIVGILGRSRIRLDVFENIYGRGSRPKTVTQIMDKLGLKPADRQLVLNEVNHLAKHGVISKVEIPRSTGRGKENGYGKINYVMANKAEILRKRENPKLLKSTPTKRRPEVSVVVKVPKSVGNRRKVTAKLKVLYLTATPDSQGRLRTDAEVRMVNDAIERAGFRDDVDIKHSPAADGNSLLDGLNRHRPQIVHFSGHGGGKSVWLDDGKVEGSVGQSMDFGLLAETLAATDTPPTLVVLNACDTLDGADVLLDVVDAVIGMSDSISDLGAATFATKFYAALANGQSVSSALKQGKAAMKMAMLEDADLPQLRHRSDVDPKTLVFVGKRKR
ncbi:hypothetical protein AUC71_00930 [Methyloceanibacter marginalis]|uniref:CHAT domain-containing protein n=1 Tax=Methyloceanibacter marginalis TaxID=1774971 RepID=A0A1E3WC94_9HYPH|nr:CHAT domain-containing protein [Methyloceanibacter marginalis]ODS03411.1 hypothetical protein AUC71_00930 [Methyloceanibacter marginalis]